MSAGDRALLEAGQGSMGLPLSMRAVEKGIDVTGVDFDRYGITVLDKRDVLRQRDAILL